MIESHDDTKLFGGKSKESKSVLPWQRPEILETKEIAGRRKASNEAADKKHNKHPTNLSRKTNRPSLISNQ